MSERRDGAQLNCRTQAKSDRRMVSVFNATLQDRLTHLHQVPQARVRDTLAWAWEHPAREQRTAPTEPDGCRSVLYAGLQEVGGPGLEPGTSAWKFERSVL